MASATAYPMPSAAPVTTTVFPFRESWLRTLVGVFGVGRGKPSRMTAQSVGVMDILVLFRMYYVGEGEVDVFGIPGV